MCKLSLFCTLFAFVIKLYKYSIEHDSPKNKISINSVIQNSILVYNTISFLENINTLRLYKNNL